MATLSLSVGEEKVVAEAVVSAFTTSVDGLEGLLLRRRHTMGGGAMGSGNGWSVSALPAMGWDGEASGVERDGET